MKTWLKGVLIIFLLSCTSSHEIYTPRFPSFNIEKESDRMRLVALDSALRSGDLGLYRLLENYNVKIRDEKEKFILEYRLKEEVIKSDGLGFDSDYNVEISKDLKKQVFLLYQ